MDSAERTGRATDRRTLDGVKLLGSLDAEIRAALEGKCAWRRYRLGERVFERGTDAREVLFVIEGAVNIVSFAAIGSELIFATAGAGETIGELAAIDGQPRSASVTSIEKTDLAMMPPDVFTDLIRSRGEVSFLLLQRMAKTVRASGLRIMELSTLQAAQRVYSELLRMAEPEPAVPGLWVIRPLPPMHEIASMTSTTRETVNRAISQLYPVGLLKRKGRNLYLMDKARLEEVVQTLAAHHHGGK